MPKCKSENNLHKAVLSLHYVGPGDGTQILKLSGRLLYLLSILLVLLKLRFHLYALKLLVSFIMKPCRSSCQTTTQLVPTVVALGNYRAGANCLSHQCHGCISFYCTSLRNLLLPASDILLTVYNYLCRCILSFRFYFTTVR